MQTVKYLTVSQFANLMSISEACVRQAIKSGRIHAFRPGAGTRSPWRIPHTEAERIQLMSHQEMISNLKD